LNTPKILSLILAGCFLAGPSPSFADARSPAKQQEARQYDARAVDQQVAETVLPDNPTAEDCQAYITALRALAATRRSHGTNDPLIQKLREVPVQQMYLLMDEIRQESSLRIYADHAMRGIDADELQEWFVSTLRENPQNIGIIVMHGWVELVRPVVIDYIMAAEGDVPAAWFQAAIELNEPRLYASLHQITINSYQAPLYITMLKTLPDYDVVRTVHHTWTRYAAGQSPVPAASEGSLALIAAQHGEVDALGILINQLNAPGMFINYTTGDSMYNGFRASVLALFEFRGTNAQIHAWYEQNHESLVFDYVHQCFVMPEPF